MHYSLIVLLLEVHSYLAIDVMIVGIYDVIGKQQAVMPKPLQEIGIW